MTIHPFDFIQFILADHERLVDLLADHVLLTVLSVLAATLVGMPLGVLASRIPLLTRPVIWLTGLGETIPSLAILGLMIPLVGIGFWPAMIALTVKAILPILLNTFIGLREIEHSVLDAARGMGGNNGQRLFLIELPIAMPIILAGLQTATVQNVASATLAAFIGGGGLGELILQGLSLMDPAMLLAGAVPIALLAIFAEIGMRELERVLVSRGLKVV